MIIEVPMPSSDNEASSVVFFPRLRGTLPLAIFGPQNYGYRLGIIGAPARMAQAIAPLAFGLLIDIMGSRILMVSSALSLSALLALLLLGKRSSAP